MIAVAPSPPSDAATRFEALQREPYRIFFPQGILLAIAGIGHWTLHALGVLEDYRSVFHAMTLVQGFMLSFVAGFLFTMLPKRTQSARAAKWQIAVGVIGPVGTSIGAWFGNWSVSQTFFFVFAIVLFEFVTRRIVTGQRRPPDAFVWIPIAFIIGLIGGVLAAVGAALSGEYWWLHTVGRGLVLQGMMAALVIGVGGLVIPLMTRGAKPSDAAATADSRWWRAGHALMAAVLFGSFFVEHYHSLRVGLAIRALITAAALLAGAELWRLPTRPGWARRLIWAAPWFVPIGFAIAAIFHEEYKAGLHVVFIGGFATLALAVGAHVTYAHGGFDELRDGRPKSIAFLALALAVALSFRVAMVFDREGFFEWMAIASISLLCGLVVVAFDLLPKIVRPK